MLRRIGYPRLLFLGSDRDTYLEALRFGNNGDYARMIEIFSNLIIEQRLESLTENLKKVVIPPKKTGQVRLTDFFKQTVGTEHAIDSPLLNEQRQPAT